MASPTPSARQFLSNNPREYFELLSKWFEESTNKLKLNKFGQMALRYGTSIRKYTEFDGSEDEEEDDDDDIPELDVLDDDIQEIKENVRQESLTPLIKDYTDSSKELGFRESSTTLHGTTNCSMRRETIDKLKRKPLVSNPPTELGMILGTGPEVLATESDDMENSSASSSQKPFRGLGKSPKSSASVPKNSPYKRSTAARRVYTQNERFLPVLKKKKAAAKKAEKLDLPVNDKMSAADFVQSLDWLRESAKMSSNGLQDIDMSHFQAMMDSIKAKEPSISLLSQDQLADLNTSLNTLFSILCSGVVQPSAPSTHCLQPCYNSPCLDSAYSRAFQAMQSAPFTARATARPAVAASQNPAMRAGMNARPITGQQPTAAAAAAAAAGTRVAMGPTGVAAARPATMAAAHVNPARPAYKYTSNMRNPPQPLTASMLADANAQERKQMLGERLFPVIHRWYPDLAGKITGMLLEIDNSELLHMLEHHKSLKAKVEEAVAVLQVHHAKETLSVAGGIKKEG